MAVRLHKSAFAYAKELIKKKRVALDDRDAWSEHQPTAEQENEFIGLHGYDEYRKWHLGIDEKEESDTKKRYKFPYWRLPHRPPLWSAFCRKQGGIVQT
jgi:hypothetical protein